MSASNTRIRWFCKDACVVQSGERFTVCVGNVVIGSFQPGEPGPRNRLLVELSRNPQLRRGRLASAFLISAERLRQILRHVETHGIKALPTARRGRQQITEPVSQALQRRLYRLFDQGKSGRAAYALVRPRHRVSRTVVHQLHRTWLAENSASPDEAMAGRTRKGRDDEVDSSAQQVSLFPELDEAPAAAPASAPAATSRTSRLPELPVLLKPTVRAAVRAADHVQHVGSWLMLAAAEQHGLYYNILGHWGSRRGADRMRCALDGVLMSLAIGQGCVEGVRRLETASAPQLYRAKQAPSASWVRRTWKLFCEKVPAWQIQASMIGAYLRQVEVSNEQAAAFYVDNHMRPYTGKQVLRKGWRMQDKRAEPGCTDYWVHDEWGQPLMKVAVPDNGALTSWLKGIAQLLQLGLGDHQRLLIAFDRAGAYPEHLAELRDRNVEFVTYERRPYPQFSASAFTETIVWRGERLGVHDGRANLKKGRGRVRRIALRMPDGYQVNVLTSSQEPKERLIEVMLGRWCQENAFKHGVERWGMNQLDRRQVEPYDPETVIPNPARRRLDREMRLLRVEEGLARRDLARLPKGETRRRERLEKKLQKAMERQEHLETLRPGTPTHAPLEETELAGELVHHVQDVKLVLDTIRVVCANAESDYAYSLASFLPRGAEAKMNLKNLFLAPGKVTVGRKAVHVYLQPAGSPAEQEAYEAFYEEINEWGLMMPADHPPRVLQFHPHPG